MQCHGPANVIVGPHRWHYKRYTFVTAWENEFLIGEIKLTSKKWRRIRPRPLP